MRLIKLAVAAASSFSIQSCDVPGTYPRAPLDQNHLQTITQPLLFDGRYMHPGNVCLLVCEIPGASDAGGRWKLYQDSKLQVWVWQSSRKESGIYWLLFTNGTLFWLLSNTDDFLVLEPSYLSLSSLRAQFNSCWKSQFKSFQTPHLLLFMLD